MRRKYLKMVRHRGYSHGAHDQWLTWESAKTALPLVSATLLAMAIGVNAVGTAVFAVGAALSALWFAFVQWT